MLESIICYKSTLFKYFVQKLHWISFCTKATLNMCFVYEFVFKTLKTFLSPPKKLDDTINKKPFWQALLSLICKPNISLPRVAALSNFLIYGLSNSWHFRETKNWMAPKRALFKVFKRLLHFLYFFGFCVWSAFCANNSSAKQSGRDFWLVSSEPIIRIKLR